MVVGLLIWPIGGIDDHHCIERWLLVLLICPIGRIDDHHCIERWLLVLLIWPIGGIDDHHCIEGLESIVTFSNLTDLSCLQN